MRSLLMTIVGVAAGLASTQVGVSPVSAATEPVRLMVMPFGFFDTSGEPRDQKAEHLARLAAMSHDLGSELEHKGLYRVVGPSPEVPCPAGDTDCILSEARQAGAGLVLAGAVQKVSTMASSIWVGAFDAASGRRVFFRQLTFRGDTDDAWQHATAFLSREIEENPPALQPQADKPMGENQ